MKEEDFHDKLPPSIRRRRKPKYPVRLWLGKYEAWISVMGKSLDTKKLVSSTLERFLGLFPTYRGIEQFTTTDVADYIVIRERTQKPYLVDKDLWIIFRFWEWMIHQKGLFLYNIVNAYKNRAKHPCVLTCRKSKKSLSLEEVSRLLNSCETIELKQFVIKVLARKPYWNKWRTKFGFEWDRAVDRAGLPSDTDPTMIRARMWKGTNRLADDIIQTYCKQLLNSLAPKPELDSNSLATVEVTSLHERSTVTNGNNHLSSVDGINQQ